MAVKVILLVVLACLTVRQHAIWRDNVSLWASAVRVAPYSPRAAFNLAVAYRRDTQIDRAMQWLIRAEAVRMGHPDEAEMARWIRSQVISMQMFGLPVCDQLLLSDYC